jgi:hypothetical protein
MAVIAALPTFNYGTPGVRNAPQMQASLPGWLLELPSP